MRCLRLIVRVAPSVAHDVHVVSAPDDATVNRAIEVIAVINGLAVVVDVAAHIPGLVADISDRALGCDESDRCVLDGGSPGAYR